MSQLTNALGAGAGSNSATASTGKDAFNDIDLNVFLELMITELQNQDPLNPLENDQLLAQISQIREVGATDKLTETLDAVLIGQNVSSATNLIGADVVALTDKGERVNGNVQSVTIADGQPKLDLAVDIGTSAGATEGDLDDGTYLYNIVWEGAGGALFGMEVQANTAGLTGFDGSVQINNLPETSTQKLIYRTDKSGSGSKQLIGSIRGGATAMLDTVSDANRGAEALNTQPQLVDFARKATVSLKNISEINPPR
ncbi:Basal-body rod modification protein FlgD [Posidoniimonas polymericola]|uniref:Basal-body rod modification protein FlgD n=1 Tax=Posidoniimonas polymericola TaxID=2528002 RepID=A0A5C5YQT5_9BACT|nr:flagellar hook capping FlgD N-terminal domain-containing protein [Posidoniimonas polymericola]TWT77223.1 Basal-body rod modification protein FlgD [Posidoniimonas polymericola]